MSARPFGSDVSTKLAGLNDPFSASATVDPLYEKIRAEKGRLDVLFANAGGDAMVPLGDITEAHYHDTFDRNVKGTLFTVQKALPLLWKGASVTLAESTTTIEGTAAFSVNSALKAAIRNFARSWILDLKDRGFRVYTISPGATKTPGLVELAGPDETQQQGLLDYLASRIPMGRVGDPGEIAATAFLASDSSSFVNWAELFVDGGQAQV
ncbi:SDR family NAD(P)-dependent oxidoreductase [Caballeronia sp. LZ035]|uniref:SDR family NAD(P)-dependent oxidoreductase n=1 Tax=Caballeronia sp. LZ035 TaxID=3038568 RepID=UPI0038D4D476